VSGIYVRVRVGAEAYALPVEHVLEVSELGDVAAVPRAPAPTMGVTNLRGQVLPVFDLAGVFGLARADTPTRLLVAEDNGQRAGLAIDDVTDVGPLQEALQESDSELLAGASLDGGSLIGVIDVARLFAVLGGEPA